MTDAPFEQKTETQPVSNFAKSKHAPTVIPSSTNTNTKDVDKAKLTGKRVEVSSKSNNMYTTCSGHISKPAMQMQTMTLSQDVDSTQLELKLKLKLKLKLEL